jgi:hypothetical protein
MLIPDQLPGAILAAIIDEDDLAVSANLAALDQEVKKCTHAPGRFGQHLLLIEAGNDDG